MATQSEVTRSYDPIDAIHEAAFGTFADVTCAFYEGDFTLSLEQAQQRKHEFVFESLGLEAGGTLFDIGCGWGPLLDAARRRGIVASGVTLSTTQHQRCQSEGLDVELRDWKDVDADETPGFQGVASLGAFEHFVGPDEMLAGEQDEVYRDFFRLCSDLLPDRGKLFLQTMTWGSRVPHPDELDIHAPKLSDQWVMGYLSYLYPGSWLPNGLEHIAECAAEHFDVTYHSNGRKDYIKTMYAWGEHLDRLGWRKWSILAPVFARSVFDPDLRRLLTALRYACARECFEREIFSHYRIVLEKR
jgi:cyclopropane-fatty-acyl-phospholipid synthase